MKIGHFPQHIGVQTEHNLKAEKSLGLRSVGHTEMDPGNHSLIPLMRKVMHPVTVCTDDGGNLGQHSQETVIAAREDSVHRVEDHYVKHLSPNMGGGPHQDRYMTVVKWRKYWRGKPTRRKWAHIAVHLSFGSQDPRTGRTRSTTIADAYVKAVKRIEAEIDSLVADGYEVVVSGDWNWRQHPGVTWAYSPPAVAARHHMAIYSDGLDHVMWTRGLVRVTPVKVYAKGTAFNRSDHPWIVVTLIFHPFRRAKKK